MPARRRFIEAADGGTGRPPCLRVRTTISAPFPASLRRIEAEAAFREGAGPFRVRMSAGPRVRPLAAERVA